MRASLDVLAPWVSVGSGHTYTIGVPTNPALVDRWLYTTVAAFVPGINPFGAITANGFAGTSATPDGAVPAAASLAAVAFAAPDGTPVRR